MSTPSEPYQSEHLASEPTRASVDAAPGWVLLEFGAPWCGHCIAAQPALQQLLAGRVGVRHVKVEDGAGRPLGRSFRIKLWPTLVLMRDGLEQMRLVRPVSLSDMAPLDAALPPR